MNRRTPLRSNTSLKRYTPLRSKKRIAVKGHTDTSQIKEEIQAVVRSIVIARDGGCILRELTTISHTPRTGDDGLTRVSMSYPSIGLPQCGGYRKDGELILQADHLVTRANAATFADTRLVVCLCKAHHGWKSVGSNARKAEYDALVRTLISPERAALWDRCEAESWRPRRDKAYNWAVTLAALKQERRDLGSVVDRDHNLRL